MFFVLSCAEQSKNSTENTSVLSVLSQSLAKAAEVKTSLLHRADSLKVINEFEALKIYNSLQILDENVGALTLYKDSLVMPQKRSNEYEKNLELTALTQAEYVNSLVAAGAALVDNRSFSFGQWKEGTPKAMHDSIMTPVKK